MKKGLTELAFILDRSGSMAGLEKDTIGGFNAMVKKQNETDGEAVITTVLFDDKYEILHDRMDVRGVLPMTEEQYYVRGCTALLDAVGRTIEKIDHAQRMTAEPMQADKVIIVITTDGMENASRRYGRHRVKQMIEAHKEMGWEFIFLGANMDAVAEAAAFGIDEDRAVTYENDSAGVKLNYQVMADTVAAMRCSSARIDGSWKERIERDRRERGMVRSGDRDGRK